MSFQVNVCAAGNCFLVFCVVPVFLFLTSSLPKAPLPRGDSKDRSGPTTAHTGDGGGVEGARGLV